MAVKKTYADAERALYAQYIGKRESIKPDRCCMAGRCWVVLGPPGLNTDGGYSKCFECKCTVPGRYHASA